MGAACGATSAPSVATGPSGTELRFFHGASRVDGPERRGASTRDPSNTQRELRERRDLLGYPELSTHAFRKTAATILDRAGLSATEIADYLGHENPSMTQDVYMNTLKGSTAAAAILDDALAGLI
ncbi:tyrosine-type recombinase/integrase [Microbacterium sp. GXF7504]